MTIFSQLPLQPEASNLPPSFQNFNLGAASFDARALMHLASFAIDSMLDVEIKNGAPRDSMERLGCLLSLIHARAEQLQWQLETLEKTHCCVPKVG